MTAVDLDALDKLRAAATPGPWQAYPKHPDAQSKGTVDLPTDTSSDPYVAVCWRNTADAALIVAAVNALPDLIAALRRVEALVAREECENTRLGVSKKSAVSSLLRELRRALAPQCDMRKPGGTTTCIEPAGHAGPDGRDQSHGDGSVTRWIYR